MISRDRREERVSCWEIKIAGVQLYAGSESCKCFLVQLSVFLASTRHHVGLHIVSFCQFSAKLGTIDADTLPTSAMHCYASSGEIATNAVF